MIIIGEVLRKEGGNSCLYSPSFSHSYRAGISSPDSRHQLKANAQSSIPASCGTDGIAGKNTLSAPSSHEKYSFRGRIALLPVTNQGFRTASSIAEKFECAEIYVPESLQVCANFSHTVFRIRRGSLAETVKNIWNRYDGLVFICASGIAVRAIAPLCGSKTQDPAVIVCDEEGKYVVSLLSGHIGGANLLARQTAELTGGQAVLSTASDCRNLPALDDIAARNLWRILNPEVIGKTAQSILSGQKLDLAVPERIFSRVFASFSKQFRRVDSVQDIRSETGFALLKTQKDFQNFKGKPFSEKILFAAPPDIVLGIGCRKGVSEQQIETALKTALQKLPGSFEIKNIARIATADFKCSEVALKAFCSRHNIELCGFSADELNLKDVPHPSPKAWEHFGIHSVCEAAAMAGAHTEKLILFKQKTDSVTVAAAELHHNHIPNSPSSEKSGKES